MKINKFIALGINTVFDTFDKSRLYINYSQFLVQGLGGFIVAVSKL